MKASELRMGNWVHTGRGVAAVEMDSLGISRFEEGYEEYKPIPLTEEWLLKFGFVKRRGLTGNVFNSLVCTYIEFQFDNDGLGISIEGQYLSLPHIKHVHQLQNIYFALTGNELTIKE